MLRDQPAERAEETKAILDRLTRDTKEESLLQVVRLLYLYLYLKVTH
jgi:hypothetical protein